MMIRILILLLLFRLNNWFIPVTYITCYHITPNSILRTIATRNDVVHKILLFHQPSFPTYITATTCTTATTTTKLKSIYTISNFDHTKNHQIQNIDNDHHTNTIASQSNDVVDCITATSKSFGNITRIQLHVPNHDINNNSNDTISYVEKMSIPTFVCSGNGLLEYIDESDEVTMNRLPLPVCTNLTWNMMNHVSTSSTPIVVNDSIDNNAHDYNERYGPAFTISSILSPSICQDIISSCEAVMSSVFQQQQQQKRQQPILEDEQASSHHSNHKSSNIDDSNSNKKNHHGAMQLIISPETANIIAQRIAPFIPIHLVEERKSELEEHQSLTFRNQNNNNPNNTNINEQQQDQNQEQLERKPNSKLLFVGLNRRFRIYKYLSNNYDHFKPHIDAGFPPSGVRTVPVLSQSSNNITTTTNVLQFDDTNQYISALLQNKYPQFYNATTTTISNNTTSIKDVVSRLTILFYLNENFMGGTTNFYEPLTMRSPMQDSHTNNQSSQVVPTITTNTLPSKMIASVKPQTGMCLIFPQCVGEDVMDSYAKYYWPTHEGSPVQSLTSSLTTTATAQTEPKYVIRSDLLFAEVIT
jgi:hypothetical protein